VRASSHVWKLSCAPESFARRVGKGGLGGNGGGGGASEALGLSQARLQAERGNKRN
jgi:hypothetical protein